MLNQVGNNIVLQRMAILPQGFSFSLVAMSSRIRLFFETAYSLSGYRGDRALNGTGERCQDSLVSGGGKDNWCKKNGMRIKKCPDVALNGRGAERAADLIGQDGPFLSSKISHFQNEVECKTFLEKISFVCMRIKNHFSINGRHLTAL